MRTRSVTIPRTGNTIVTGPPSGDETDFMQGAQPGIDDALDTILLSLDGVDTIPARWRRWRSGIFPRRNAATAAPRLTRRSQTMSSTTGELVTETLAYDGGRQVTAYVPPQTPQAVVFAGDGQLIAPCGAFLNQAATLPPTMIVAAHRLADEMERLHEYSPGFDANRFAAHERFFVTDVRAWARERFDVALPAERTAVFGVSASGELALAIGLRHPDIFGAIWCASPGGGYQPPGDMQRLVPRTYLVAGTEEPFFQANAARWAEALRAAQADVIVTERAGAHGDAFWRDELPLMAAWAFGR